MPETTTNRGKIVRVGVLGCGNLVQAIHLPALLKIPGVRVVALAEPDRERLERAAGRVPGVFATSDWQEAAHHPEVDALVIALPNYLHAPAAISALENGKHIYLEKPLTTTTEEGETILAAWKKNPCRVGMIGFNYRFNPLLEAVRQRLTAGEIGELVGVRSVFVTPATNALPEWKKRSATGGGALLDLASHHLDLLPYLTGQAVSEVSALQLSQRSEGDSVVLNLKLGENGPLAQIFVSLCAGDDDAWEFYGQRGKLSVNRYDSFAVQFTPPHRQTNGRLPALLLAVRQLPQLTYLLQKRLSVGYEPSFQAALHGFIHAVRSETPARPDLEDGLRSLKLVEAAHQSLQSGRGVNLL